MTLRGPRMIAVVSPWLSDVEIGLRAGAWHQQITVGEATSASLQTILTEYCRAGWDTHVAVLAYGLNPSGIEKPLEKFGHERRLLKRLISQGAHIHLVPDLHAKGVVTPLGVITVPRTSQTVVYTRGSERQLLLHTTTQTTKRTGSS